MCTRCSPRVTAHCSSESQFLRSLSLVIVCAVRDSHRRGARIFNVSRCPIVRPASIRNEIQGELRFESTRTHELDTITRLVPKDPADLRLLYGPTSEYRFSFFFLFDAHGKKHHRNQSTQCSRNFIDK